MTMIPGVAVQNTYYCVNAQIACAMCFSTKVNEPAKKVLYRIPWRSWNFNCLRKKSQHVMIIIRHEIQTKTINTKRVQCKGIINKINKTRFGSLLFCLCASAGSAFVSLLIITLRHIWWMHLLILYAIQPVKWKKKIEKEKKRKRSMTKVPFNHQWSGWT